MINRGVNCWRLTTVSFFFSHCVFLKTLEENTCRRNYFLALLKLCCLEGVWKIREDVSMINMGTSFYWDHVIKYKFGERVFDTTQKSAVVFKEVKTIFCILCGKIQDSLQKYHILNAEYEHQFIQINFTSRNWLNWKHRVHQHALQ